MDSLWEKEFFQINQSIINSNYPNFSLVLEKNVGSTKVGGLLG